MGLDEGREATHIRMSWSVRGSTKLTSSVDRQAAACACQPRLDDDTMVHCKTKRGPSDLDDWQVRSRGGNDSAPLNGSAAAEARTRILRR